MWLYKIRIKGVPYKKLCIPALILMVIVFSGPATMVMRSTPRWMTWPTTRSTACSSQCPRPPTPQWGPLHLNFTFQTTSTTCHLQAALLGRRQRPHPHPLLQVCHQEYLELEGVLIQVAFYQIPRHWVYTTQNHRTITILLQCTDRKRFTSSVFVKQRNNVIYDTYELIW